MTKRFAYVVWLACVLSVCLVGAQGKPAERKVVIELTQEQADALQAEAEKANTTPADLLKTRAEAATRNAQAQLYRRRAAKLLLAPAAVLEQLDRVVLPEDFDINGEIAKKLGVPPRQGPPTPTR